MGTMAPERKRIILSFIIFKPRADSNENAETPMAKSILTEIKKEKKTETAKKTRFNPGTIGTLNTRIINRLILIRNYCRVTRRPCIRQ